MGSARPDHLFSTMPRPRRRSLISLTPLIDMVFILLVFFMLASVPQHWRAITVVATAGGPAAEGMSGAILVRVDAETLRLNGRPLDLPTLGEQVRQRVARNPAQKVLVEPAPGVTLQAAVTVLDRLTQIGVTNLSLTAAGRR